MIAFLLISILLMFEPLCFERGLTAQSSIESGIRLIGSKSHLQQVTDILLDNAQKYGTQGTEVTVTLSRKGRCHCLLSVSSRGKSISKADLKNIFKRFYQVDKARTHRDSYGLGLFIAQQPIQLHKGKIWAEIEEGLNTFFVQLPTSSS